MDVGDVASIDFETASEADLKKCGAARYAEHPSTQVLCLAWQLPTMHDPQIWIPAMPFPKPLRDWIVGGGKVSGWNVLFEFYIWNVVLRRQLKSEPVPKLRLDQLLDTMAVAAFNGLPLGLDKCAEALPQLGIRKDKVGHALMLRMSRPRDKKKLTWWHEDDPAKYRELQAYCVQDVRVERKILMEILPLPKRERRIWEMDAEASIRGMMLDRPLAVRMQALAEHESKKLDQRMWQVTGGLVTSTKAVGQLLTYAKGIEPKITSLAKDQLAKWIAHLSSLTQPTPLQMELEKALKLRQQAAKSSVAKLKAMLNFANEADDRMRGLYQFYGAFRTGRDAGRGPQIQNFPRGSVKDIEALIEYIWNGPDAAGWQLFFGVDPLEALSSALRSCVTVPDDKWFCSYDFSQIEARVTPWLAGDERMMNVFRAGRDIYVVAAADIFNCLEDMVTDSMRQIGKVCVLALGFGGGVGAFQNMAKVYGVEVDDQRADDIKTEWRDKNKRIVKFWWDLEAAAIKTVETGQRTHVGHIKFEWHQGNLHMVLPVGRPLIYREAEIGVNKFGSKCVTYMGLDQYTNQWKRIDTYGGKLCENATQAVARDVMKTAALRLRKVVHGALLLGPIHDELLNEIDHPDVAKEIHRVMNLGIHWAPGLPIKAEGYVGKRFKK